MFSEEDGTSGLVALASRNTKNNKKEMREATRAATVKNVFMRERNNKAFRFASARSERLGRLLRGCCGQTGRYLVQCK